MIWLKYWYCLKWHKTPFNQSINESLRTDIVLFADKIFTSRLDSLEYAVSLISGLNSTYAMPWLLLIPLIKVFRNFLGKGENAGNKHDNFHLISFNLSWYSRCVSFVTELDRDEGIKSKFKFLNAFMKIYFFATQSWVIPSFYSFIRNSDFWVAFILLCAKFANAFNLDKSAILIFGKSLTHF